MIYVGYQGIGKSSIVGDKVLDLESSSFWVQGSRTPDWYKIYAQMAKKLSDSGHLVFISSHKVLRDYMKSEGIDFTVVCPSPDLKSEWVSKLEKRYNEDECDKNYKAWKNAESSYEEDITDLLKEEQVIVIADMNYNLSELIGLYFTELTDDFLEKNNFVEQSKTIGGVLVDIWRSGGYNSYHVSLKKDEGGIIKSIEADVKYVQEFQKLLRIWPGNDELNKYSFKLIF